jgi:hypothetical protein
MHAKTWNVSIYLSETDDGTEARAVLHTEDTDYVEGHGRARHHPRDPQIPEIGDELAVARALSDLSHRLFEMTTRDLEDVLHERIFLTR